MFPGRESRGLPLALIGSVPRNSGKAAKTRRGWLPGEQHQLPSALTLASFSAFGAREGVARSGKVGVHTRTLREGMIQTSNRERCGGGLAPLGGSRATMMPKVRHLLRSRRSFLETLPLVDAGRDFITLLIRRAKTGDEQAQRQLFERLRSRFERTIHSQLGPVARAGLAETGSILSELWLDLCKRLPLLQGDSVDDVMAVATVVVRNRIRDAAKVARRQKRDHRRQQPLAQTGSSSPGGVRVSSPDPSPTQEARARELEVRIGRLLERLDPQDRELIRLRREEDATPAQLAASLGIDSGNAARMRLNRALKRLSEWLAQGQG